MRQIGVSRTDRSPAGKAQYPLRRLRQEIADGVIRPGEALRHSNLAKRYGISPTPLREALRLPKSEGTVDYLPHRGATLDVVSEQQMQHIYTLRAQ